MFLLSNGANRIPPFRDVPTEAAHWKDDLPMGEHLSPIHHRLIPFSRSPKKINSNLIESMKSENLEIKKETLTSLNTVQWEREFSYSDFDWILIFFWFHQWLFL